MTDIAATDPSAAAVAVATRVAANITKPWYTSKKLWLTAIAFAVSCKSVAASPLSGR